MYMRIQVLAALSRRGRAKYAYSIFLPNLNYHSFVTCLPFLVEMVFTHYSSPSSELSKLFYVFSPGEPQYYFKLQNKSVDMVVGMSSTLEINFRRMSIFTILGVSIHLSKNRGVFRCVCLLNIPQRVILSLLHVDALISY